MSRSLMEEAMARETLAPRGAPSWVCLEAVLTQAHTPWESGSQRSQAPSPVRLLESGGKDKAWERGCSDSLHPLGREKRLSCHSVSISKNLPADTDRDLKQECETVGKERNDRQTIKTRLWETVEESRTWGGQREMRACGLAWMRV